MSPRELTSFALWMSDAPPDTLVHTSAAIMQVLTTIPEARILSASALCMLALNAIRNTNEIPLTSGINYA